MAASQSLWSLVFCYKGRLLPFSVITSCVAVHALPYIKLLNNRAGPRRMGENGLRVHRPSAHVVFVRESDTTHLSALETQIIVFYECVCCPRVPVCEARRSREARLHQTVIKRSNQISMECVWAVQQTSTQCLTDHLDLDGLRGLLNSNS